MRSFDPGEARYRHKSHNSAFKRRELSLFSQVNYGLLLHKRIMDCSFWFGIQLFMGPIRGKIQAESRVIRA